MKNFVFLLCMALLKPKRNPPHDRKFLHNEIYESIKQRFRSVLLASTGIGPEAIISHLSEEIVSSCSEPDCSLLPDGSILSRILEIQKLADIEGGVGNLYSLYKKICPVHRPSPIFVQEGRKAKRSKGMSELNGNAHMEGLPPMAIPTLGACGCSGCSCDESGCELESSSSSSSAGEFSGNEEDDEEEEVTLKDDLEDEECPSASCLVDEKWLDELGVKLPLTKEEKEALEHYLIAATAKDCSIMITFSPVRGPKVQDVTLSEAEADSIGSLYSPKSPSIANYEDSDLILEDLNGTFHRVRIGVADLDPKPVSSIVKHFLRDRDMIKDFHDFLQK
jgi:hypothetical protein